MVLDCQLRDPTSPPPESLYNEIPGLSSVVALTTRLDCGLGSLIPILPSLLIVREFLWLLLPSLWVKNTSGD